MGRSYWLRNYGQIVDDAITPVFSLMWTGEVNAQQTMDQAVQEGKNCCKVGYSNNKRNFRLRDFRLRDGDILVSSILTLCGNQWRLQALHNTDQIYRLRLGTFFK